MEQRAENQRKAARVAIASTLVWLVGIAPVPRVYTESDPARRLSLLEAGRRSWVIGEHLAGAGTAAVPAAFTRVALALPPGPGRRLAAAGAAALAVGAPFFVWELAVRTSDIERFAYRRMPGWPFAAYAWLQVAAVAALAGSLATMPDHRKDAAAVGAIAAGSAGYLAKTGDVAPFLFYVAEQIAAASLLRRRAG